MSLSSLVNSPLLLVEALAWTASPEFLRREGQGSSSFSLGEQAWVLESVLLDELLPQEEPAVPSLRQQEALS
jgi:hypothetical protein